MSGKSHLICLKPENSYNYNFFLYSLLSHDVAFVSDIMLCNKIELVL